MRHFVAGMVAGLLIAAAGAWAFDNGVDSMQTFNERMERLRDATNQRTVIERESARRHPC